jgi:hypothetical protein
LAGGRLAGAYPSLLMSSTCVWPDGTRINETPITSCRSTPYWQDLDIIDCLNLGAVHPELVDIDTSLF